MVTRPGALELVAGMTDDAAKLVQYLREHYGKQKIFLLGHSWGSVLGVLTLVFVGSFRFEISVVARQLPASHKAPQVDQAAPAAGPARSRSNERAGPLQHLTCLEKRRSSFFD